MTRHLTRKAIATIFAAALIGGAGTGVATADPQPVGHHQTVQRHHHRHCHYVPKRVVITYRHGHRVVIIFPAHFQCGFPHHSHGHNWGWGDDDNYRDNN